MHVAIIMDGNGRWAQQRGWPRWKGHIAGVESVRSIVRFAPTAGITTLTLYAFSSDNWKRPAAEVEKLFHLLRRYCRGEASKLQSEGVRVSAIGRRDRIPTRTLGELERLEESTSHCTRLHLRLALDYSSRNIIAHAVRYLASEANHQRAATEMSWQDLHELITAGVPDPDLLIRTAGEKRLSDFLLWELSYAELYFTDVQWPDFREEHLAGALAEFHRRGRRFGAISDDDSSDMIPKRLAG